MNASLLRFALWLNPPAYRVCTKLWYHAHTQRHGERAHSSLLDPPWEGIPGLGLIVARLKTSGVLSSKHRVRSRSGVGSIWAVE